MAEQSNITASDIPEADLDRAPHLFWALTEFLRVIFELLAHFIMRPFLSRLPKGDGHPVMAAPGFLGGDGSTKMLRKFLQRLGYDAHGWGLGQNKVFSHERVDEFGEQVRALHQKTGRKVTLIGWSLGGLFVREAAKRNPDCVRAVITLGSPLSGNFDHTWASWVYEKMNGAPSEEQLAHFTTLPINPPLPTTSIYSKADGIVAWRNSILETSPQSENIRVTASHCGMGCNPQILKIVANRVSQPEGTWTKFVKDRPAHSEMPPNRKTSA